MYAAETAPIYAEKEVDFAVPDVVEPAKGDEGYLPVDVEYEQPNKISLLPTPAPPSVFCCPREKPKWPVGPDVYPDGGISDSASVLKDGANDDNVR